MEVLRKEIIEKVIGLDIKVLTSKGEEKTISFSDIQSGRGLEASLSMYNEYDNYPISDALRSLDIFKTIEVKIQTFGFSMEIK